jgi:chromatin remodeling complex protein RSC6
VTLIPPIMITIMIRVDDAPRRQKTTCDQRVKRKLHDKPHDFEPSKPLQFNAWLPW